MTMRIRQDQPSAQCLLKIWQQIQRQDLIQIQVCLLEIKIFTFFRLADSSIVPNTDSATTKWDIGFRGSTIIINGGSSGPGQGGAFIFSGLFSDLKEVPADSTFRVDQSLSNTAIGKGWYDYNGAAMVFTPKPGKVLVIRTADNKFAKLEILSYYKNAPANPTLNDPARYFTFRYVYQADGTKKF